MSKVYYKHVRPTLTVGQEIIIIKVNGEQFEVNIITSDKDDHKIYDMTLAAKIDGDYVKIGIGVCSTDDHFSKKEGRNEANERLTYYPIFSFPTIHKKKLHSVFYWLRIVSTMIHEDSREIKNFVIRKQQIFEHTEFGIQRKMERQRQRVEDEEQEKAVKAAKKVLYLAKRNEYKV